MRYYPAFLDLKNKKCIVVGGGAVAERKVKSLIAAGAAVRVVSPVLGRGLTLLRRNNKFSYVKSDYRKALLKKIFLVIAATDSAITNARVAKDACDLGLLVNIVDSPKISNFIAPAVLDKGDLLIAISTSAKAPCLSKKIKEELSKTFIKRYVKSLKLLEGARKELKSICPDVKKRAFLLTKLVNSRIITSAKKNITKKKIRKFIDKLALTY